MVMKEVVLVGRLSPREVHIGYCGLLGSTIA